MTWRPMGVGLRGFGRQGPFEGYKFRAGTVTLLVGLMLGSLRKVAVSQRSGGRALRMRVAAELQRRGLAKLGADCGGSGAVLGVGVAR